MIRYAILTEQGNREYQEDSVFVCQENGRQLFLVADGLGGHGNGKEASHTIAECAGKLFGEEEDNDKLIQRIFLEGNQQLIKKQGEMGNFHTMKTTCVLAVVDHGVIRIAHAGDSRGYLFQKRRVLFQTLDHSVPQMLVQSGEIREKEIRKHPDRNKLLRVLGEREKEVKYTVSPALSRENIDALLLCSDGFWEYITETYMLKYLRRAKNVKEWLDAMKLHIHKAGRKEKRDNCSAIGVWFDKEKIWL